MKLQDLHRYGVASAPDRPAPPPRLGVQELLSGEIVAIGGRASFYREERFSAEYLHGPHLISEVRRVSSARLGIVARDPELAYADLTRTVFLDTETTGLAMGAGTYVFLVGAGFLDGDAFAVRQFFLGGPEDEPSFLDALDRFLRQFAVIVTFNGKAFDWPLLEGRFARFRRPPPLDDPPHLDLLHVARRLWKRRLESCALSSLEGNVIGFSRTGDDVPGWEIPYRYFRYLRAGDGMNLEGVFYHNLQDVLSMAALAVRVDRMIEDPFAGMVEHALDFLSLGRVYERCGDNEIAVMCYDEATKRASDRDHLRDALGRLSTVQKRLRSWEAALQTWDRMVEEGGEWAVTALVEMAKYYEHVERDYAAALDAAQHALLLLEMRTDSAPDSDVLELHHRLGRLVRRLSRRPVRSQM